MKHVITALFIILPLIIIGQNNTYIGLELGPKFENYQYADNGDGLYTKPFLFSPIIGLTFGKEFNKSIIGETGFFYNNYGESYRIKGESGYVASNAILAIQIPVRIKARLNIIRDKLNLISTVGYTFSINTSYGSTGSGFRFEELQNHQFNDSIRTEEMSTYSLKKTYGLIEAGLGFDFKLDNRTTLYFGANYLSGLSRIIEVDVKYWINDEPEQTGTVFSNGDYFSFVLGIQYTMSKLWDNREKRLAD